MGWTALGNALVFVTMGLAIFLAAFAVAIRMLAARLWREVVENGSVAAAILLGAIALGIAWIIAAAVH